MFESRSAEESRLVNVSDCLVRPGIIQRAWLVELAKNLTSLPTAEGWGDGLGDLRALDIGIAQAASPGGMVVLTANGVGDEGEPEIPEEMRVPETRDELAEKCEAAGFATIEWIVAAFDAPDGVLAEGETTTAILARLAQRSLNDVTSAYAFGNFEKCIVRDAHWGADVRERLDRLSLRIIELSGLEWLTEEFAPNNYGYHWVFEESEASRLSQARPGEKLPASAVQMYSPRRLTKDRRTFDRQIKTIEKELIDFPRIIGVGWEAVSQSALRLVPSYRTTSPAWLVGADDDAADWETCVCTNQFLGDDAGDLALTSLTKADLPKGPYRIAAIHSGQDWVDLVLKYPMIAVPNGDTQTFEMWSGTAHGTWVVLDWEALAEDLDGVYLSVLGALDAAYVPYAVSVGGQELWTMMTGWVPGSVMWVNSPGN